MLYHFVSSKFLEFIPETNTSAKILTHSNDINLARRVTVLLKSGSLFDCLIKKDLVGSHNF